jgi:hypothetical protein
VRSSLGLRTVLSTALRRTERLAVLLPQGRFLCLRINASRHSAVSFSTEPVARNGLSLARNGCPLSEASIPGSKVPACYFAPCQLVSPPGPPLAPLPPPVCPGWWQFLRFRPVAARLADSLGCFLCLHSPPGFLRPSGSKRSTDSAASRLAFRIRPISSRSP